MCQVCPPPTTPAALCCMQIWTINFSYTQWQTPTQIVIHEYVRACNPARLRGKGLIAQMYSYDFRLKKYQPKFEANHSI